jgi:hypothetical protein
LEPAAALREFQIAQLPREITFENPELLAAWVSAGLLLWIVKSSRQQKEAVVLVLALANIAPLLLFGARFVPRSPIEKWHALLQGGPQIQKARELVGKEMRFDEVDPGRRFALLPGSTAIYYGIHTLVDYDGFPLYPNGKSKVKRSANYLYDSNRRTGLPAQFLPASPVKNVRFVWKEDQARQVEILQETGNTITLKIPAGPAGTLIRTDTYYPGWKIVKPTECGWGRDESGFYAMKIPSEAVVVTLKYAPRWETASLGISTGALLLTFLAGFYFSRRHVAL